MRAIIYCARYDTDGLVTRSALSIIKRGIPKVYEKVDRLVSVGRWSTNPTGGWLIHDFLEFNLSKAQRDTHREAGRERQAKHRARNAVTNTFITKGTGRGSFSDAEIERCEGCGDPTPCHCADVIELKRDEAGA